MRSAEQKDPEVFQMPIPTIGLVVWRHTPDSEPYAAVVTKRGKTAISVMVFPPDSRGGLPKDGVLHINDPRLKGTQASPDSGCWDFTDATKELKALVDSLGGGK
jgi:hypothetical protein